MNNLKSILKYRGISASELGRKTGISRALISLYGRGTQPKAINLLKIAFALQVPPHSFYADNKELKQLARDNNYIF